MKEIEPQPTYLWGIPGSVTSNKRIVPIGNTARSVLGELKSSNFKKFDNLADASKGFSDD